MEWIGTWLRSAVCCAAIGTAMVPASLAGTTDEKDDLESLRQEVRALQEEVRKLKEQLATLPAAAPPVSPPLPEAAAPAPVAPPPTKSASLLNPAISAVFQAIGQTSLTREEDANGFDLSEAEVAFQSEVDPYAKVDLFLSFPVGETPEVEEAFITTMSLPAGLQLKGGRFKNALGKWNTLHTHAFFTVERPNALVNFLGEESLASDGVSLSWLIPNPAGLYLESVTEAGSALEGASFNGSKHNLTYAQHLSSFFDLSPNATLQTGVTGTFGSSGPSAGLISAIEAAGLAGTLFPQEELASRVYGFDATYKWKPLAQNVYRSFLWQTELLVSRQEREILAAGGTLDPTVIESLGGYTYAEWQTVKRWRVGGRFDLSGLPDNETAREWAGSAVLRFQPSEFQEIRLQYKHTRRNSEAALYLGAEQDDDQIFLEWIPVIGAHGAHKY